MNLRELNDVFKDCLNSVKKLPNIKVVVTGGAGVGKTSLVRMFCEGKFSRIYHQTVGVDVAFHKLYLQDNEVNITILDVGGDSNYQLVRKDLFQDVNMCLLVYDETNWSTFDGLTDFYNEIKRCSQPRPDNIILLANKVDKKQCVVKASDLEKWKIGHQLEPYEDCLSNIVVAKNSLEVVKVTVCNGEKYFERKILCLTTESHGRSSFKSILVAGERFV